MKMTFAYGNDAVVLPGAVATHIERATKRDLRVLFALAAEPLIKTDVGPTRDSQHIRYRIPPP